MGDFAVIDVCRRAGVALGLDRPDDFRPGSVVTFEGRALEVVRLHAPRPGLLLLMAVGTPVDDQRSALYELVLHLQLLMLGHADGQFVRDPIDDRLLLAMRVDLEPDGDAADLVRTVEAMSLQIAEWLGSTMAGMLDPCVLRQAGGPVRAADETAH